MLTKVLGHLKFTELSEKLNILTREEFLLISH